MSALKGEKAATWCHVYRSSILSILNLFYDSKFSQEIYERRKTSWKNVFVPEVASRFKNHKNIVSISNENLFKLNTVAIIDWRY